MLRNRAALLLGAAAVAVGAALVVDAGDLNLSWSNLWQIVGAAAVLLGVLVSVWLALPAGTRILPASLVTAGIVIFMGGSGQVTTSGDWQTLSGFTVAAVGLVMLWNVRLEQVPSADPVQTARTMFLPRRVRLAGRRLPSHQRVMAYGTAVQLDMQGTASRTEDILELSVTAVLARVEVALPGHWLVLPGRLYVSSGSLLDGTFDHTEPIHYLGSKERDDVRELVADRTDANSLRPPPYPVVVNVTGFGAQIQIIRAT